MIAEQEKAPDGRETVTGQDENNDRGKTAAAALPTQEEISAPSFARLLATELVRAYFDALDYRNEERFDCHGSSGHFRNWRRREGQP